jgi:Na+-driven multidrug efflux pump
VTDASRAEVIRLGGIVLKIIGAVQIFEAMGLVFSKALQGAGRTQFVMWVEIVVYWAVFLPVAWVLGRHFHFGVIGAWCGYAVFLATYGLTMVLKFRRGDWQQVKL